MKKLLTIVGALAIVVAGYFVFLSQESANQPASKPAPVINTDDILNATDLAAGIKEAVAKDDQQSITRWLEKGQAVGEQAGLPEADLAYLVSQKARNYVIFNAKRDLFNEQFEQHYVNLKGISELKQQYPEAKNMFEQADQLIVRRDKIIKQIAVTLAQGETVSDEHIQQAEVLWQERYRQQHNPQ